MEHLNDDHYLDANMEAQDQEAERRWVNAEGIWGHQTVKMFMAWLECEADDYHTLIVSDTPSDSKKFREGCQRWWDLNDVIFKAIPRSLSDRIIGELKEYPEWGGE